MITIRRLRRGETDIFKQMRLTALQDAPYAFSSSYESALQRSAESWQMQAESTTQGSDRATFIAFSDDLPVGIAALYRFEGQADMGEVLQVWVHPDHRGTSVARGLMGTVFEWARENKLRMIRAVVTDGNARAVKFYIKYGFSIDPSFLSDMGDVCLVKEIT